MQPQYTNDTVFKVLDGNRSTHGGDATWVLGEWQPWIDDLIPCQRGYHLCAGTHHLLKWIGPDVHTAEYRGAPVEHDGDKIVVHQARTIKHVTTWNERTARLFAADCAERVLRIWESQYPDDSHPRDAIEASRRFANDSVSQGELFAAENAAENAARDAAWSAAWSAAWAAAENAARDAAWSAARDAAWAAAWSAEREWQAEHLLWYLNGEQDD